MNLLGIGLTEIGDGGKYRADFDFETKTCNFDCWGIFLTKKVYLKILNVTLRISFETKSLQYLTD